MPQLDRLGLKENPFNNNTEQRYFYADQNRAQILESTEHLIDYSSNFQVIIGESGVGKTHLLETIANRVDNNWRIAKISNVEQYDTLSLIQAILDAFGAVDSTHSELLEALETQLAEINQLGFKPVLLLDSAQAISTDSLRFLIQLSQQKQDEEPYISIVLFVTDDVSELLQNSELRHFREIIHIATLDRFDKEGVSGFLRHKMAVAGYDRESPFTPRIIDSIFSDSQGLPEKINFFANKFLASSGKAENYITSNIDLDSSNSPEHHLNNSPELDLSESSESDPMTDLEINFDEPVDEPMDEYRTVQEDNENLVDSIKSDELQEHRSDRAAEQLSRLAEKFEEIEQLGEQPVDTFFADRGGEHQEKHNQDSFDKEESESNFFDELSTNDSTEDDAPASALPKFIIPIAVIGILFVAVLVINGVFEKSEQSDSQQAVKEQIELLPLELPPQNSYLQNDNIQKPTSVTTVNTQSEENAIEANADTLPQKQEVEPIQESAPALEVVEAIDSKTGNTTLPVIEESAISTEEKVVEVVPASIVTPKLIRIEPEPVIGSNSRQYVEVIGNHFEKDNSLLVKWPGNQKEFSAKQTPDQWQYINKKKIKLHLSTGIKSQQWEVVAKNTHGAESQSISFDVVRPFIAQMAIKQILPNPFIGSDKRQAVIVNGQGFSQQTSIELKWDKNKKHFSSRLTPSQFELVSTNQIKLFIATGKKERKWRVLATNSTGSTSSSSFTVVKKAPTVTPEKTVERFKGLNWLKQQPDTNYTIQLFGSHNKQAIDELVTKHSLKGDILRFETQKEGKPWFTMTFGNFATKQEASTAVASLDPTLTKPAPWIRTMGGIKEKLGLGVKQVPKTEVPKKVLPTGPTTLSAESLSINVRSDKKTTNITPSTTPITNTATVAASKVKDEAWIWTQNPASFTVQLIALSSKSGVDEYIKKFNLQSESVYFKTIRNKKLLYVLLYGHYSDKATAEKAGEKLSSQIAGSKPWVRRFSAVHEMMSSR